MIRKLTLTAAQTTLEKQKNMPHCLNSVKNCFPTQNFTKIGQLAAELWPKTIFSMEAIRHREFSKFRVYVT